MLHLILEVFDCIKKTKIKKTQGRSTKHRRQALTGRKSYVPPPSGRGGGQNRGRGPLGALEACKMIGQPAVSRL